MEKSTNLLRRNVWTLPLCLCWLMVEEREPEYRGKCRDPYPTIAEKAYGKAGRWFSLVCIIGVQYGTGVGFLILLAKFREEFNSLIQVFKMMSKLIMKSRQFHLIHWSSRSLVTTSWCISTFCLGWLRADWLCSGRWWSLPSAGSDKIFQTIKR